MPTIFTVKNQRRLRGSTKNESCGAADSVSALVIRRTLRGTLADPYQLPYMGCSSNGIIVKWVTCVDLVDLYYLKLEWRAYILEFRVVRRPGQAALSALGKRCQLRFVAEPVMEQWISLHHMWEHRRATHTIMQSKFTWKRWLRSTARTLQDVRKRSCRAVGSPHHQLSHTPPPSSRTDKPQHGNRGEKKSCEARSVICGRHQMDVIASV